LNISARADERYGTRNTRRTHKIRGGKAEEGLTRGPIGYPEKQKGKKKREREGRRKKEQGEEKNPLEGGVVVCPWGGREDQGRRN